MTIVIDASVALKWVLDEPRSDDALALAADDMVAPALWLAETANALWRHVRLGDLTAEQALARMTQLEKAPVASVPIEPYIMAALELATRCNHPVYDCIYLALAVSRQLPLMTDDHRFARAAARAGLGDHIRLLGG